MSRPTRTDQKFGSFDAAMRERTAPCPSRPLPQPNPCAAGPSTYGFRAAALRAGPRNDERAGGTAEGGVEACAQRFGDRLPMLPDVVDARIVGDRLQGDVRHPLVDKAVTDVAAGRRLLRRRAGDLAFLALPLRAVGEQVIRVARAHDPRPRQCQCDARGVDRDPTSAPLFRDMCSCAGAAGGIENEITWVRRQ